MTKLEKDISNYKVFCLVYHYKPNEAKSLKAYIKLKAIL